MKKNNFLKQIRNLDFIEGNNIADLGKQIGASSEEIHHIVEKIIVAKKHKLNTKNKYSFFIFIDGNFVGIYYKYGKKINEFFH
jgi:hypothetical protein